MGNTNNESEVLENIQEGVENNEQTNIENTYNESEINNDTI